MNQCHIGGTASLFTLLLLACTSLPATAGKEKNMAVEIYDLASKLGFKRVSIVGHDIGLKRNSLANQQLLNQLLKEPTL